MKKGFTLVEILVVMAIMAVVGTIMVAIFTNTLRGSNKSQILAVIKQNGQSVLADMNRVIRGADDIICPQSGSPSDTLVIAKEGIYTRFRFIPPSGNINGSINQDSPVAGSDLTAFLNSVCTDLLDPLATAVLTDTNPQSGVSVDSATFTRNKQSGFEDNVTVSFILKPGAGIPPAVSSQIDPVVFQTTVQLR